MMALLKYVSLRHLRRRGGRTALTVIGVVLGVAMMMSVFSLNGTITEAYTKLFSGLAGAAEVEVASLSAAGAGQDAFRRAATAAGVDIAAPLVQGNTIVFTPDGQASVLLLGVRPDDAEYALRTYVLRRGRLLRPDDEKAVLLTDSLATELGIQPGEDVQLLTTRGMETFAVAGLIGPGGPGLVNAGQVVVLPLGEAQRILGKIGRIDRLGLKLTPDADRTDVERALRAVVGDGVHVGPPTGGRAVDEVLGSLNLVLTFAGGISLFAAFFLMYNNVSMAMVERRREYGVLISLGLPPRALVGSVMAEVTALSLVGGGIGVGVGVAMADVMVRALGDTLAGALRLGVPGATAHPGAAAVAVGAGVVSSLAAAFVPARHAATFAPTAVLRPQRPTAPPRRRRQAVHGARLIAAGGAAVGLLLHYGTPANFDVLVWPLFAAMLVAFVGIIVVLQPLVHTLPALLGRPLQALFGVPGRLAAANLGRWPRRTATTVGALVVALSMLVGVTALTGSYRAYLHRWARTDTDWDLLVSSSWLGLGAETPMDESFRLELEAVPGVALASPERFVFLDYGSGRVYLAVFDMGEFHRFAAFRVADGPPSDAVIAALAEGQAVAVSRPFAMTHDVGAGDVVELPTPAGTHRVTVAAVVDDMSLSGGTMYIDRSLYRTLWRDDAVDAFAVKVEPGADPDAVRQSILSESPSRMPLTVQTSGEFVADLDAMVTESFSLIQALVLVALIVAALGIANTLVMTVLERRRELAELRALGATQTDLRRLVLAEAVGSGLLGSGLGALVGIVLAVVMVEANRRFLGLAYPLVMPFSLVLITAGLGLVLAPLAGWIPAQIAARLPIVAGMRVE